MEKSTAWFEVFRDGDPARQGWYDFTGWLLEEPTRMYWNGWHWGYWLGPGKSNWTQMLNCAGDRWRGLVRPNA